MAYEENPLSEEELRGAVRSRDTREAPSSDRTPAERVKDEVDEIRRSAEESQYGSSYGTSLIELSADVYSNPLNPKTRENLESRTFLEGKIGRSSGMVTPASTGKRWISVQAYNHRIFEDAYDTANTDIGLIITVAKKPSTGTGWDPVVEIVDITNYTPSQWQGSLPPNSSTKVSTVNTTDNISLYYQNNAFTPGGGATNIPSTNGYFEIDLQVIFQSGHIEYFTSQGFQNDNGPILCPVGNRYHTMLDYNWDPMSSGANTEKFNLVNACGNKANTYFYSKGMNILKGVNAIGDYSLLTRYAPIHNPSGTLIEAGYYKEYINGVSQSDSAFIELVNQVPFSWGDPLTSYLGQNGVITPDYNQTQRQSFKRIDLLFQHNNTNYHTEIFGNNTTGFIDETWFQSNYQGITLSGGFEGYDTSYTNNDISSFEHIRNRVQAAMQKQYIFSYTAYYSENITSCTPSQSTSYTVCDSQGNASHYVTTGKDCAGNTIPAADLPGGANNANVLFIHDQACCTACTLTLTANSIDASYGGTDGIITWNARDLGAPSGNPFNTGSMYTVTVTDSSGVAVGVTAPSGGNTFTDNTCDTNTTAGTANLVTCDPSNKIVPGMQVSGTGIPATGTVFVGAITAGTVSSNVTQFSLVDTAGGPINATAAGTNVTLTFSTGDTGQQGNLAPNDTANPFYTVCVTDEDGCQECVQLVVREAPNAPTGCTDNTAVNYDATAIIDDGSCILCNATSGLLEDPAGTNTTPLFGNTYAGSTSATWNSGFGASATHNSDGTLSVSASPIASAMAYMDWDANSKFEILLYKTLNPGDPSTATGAVQIGGTINAGTLDIVTTASHTFTGLAYGYYTIRVRYVDTNTVSTLEDCFTEFYGTVQAQVCDAIGNAHYMTVPSDLALQDPQNSLLCSNTIPCCTLQDITESFDLGNCNPILFSNIFCDPSRTVTVTWSYSTNGSTYTNLGSYNLGTINPGSGVTAYAAPGNNYASGHWFAQNGTGYYKVEISAVTVGHTSNTCIEQKVGYFTFPVTGCMDANAHNYNPNAVCPGQCAYPSYECDQATGQCYDPWQGTFTGYTPGQYNCLNGPGCCNSACIPPTVYGCTDSCATNYNALATQDDGSCTYTACLDQLASNYLQNCCNQNYYAANQVVGPDNSCCINPCTNPNTLDVVTTDATSTCTVFNNDGTATLTVTVNTGATTWTWELFDVQGNSIYSDGITYTGSGSAPTYTTLGTGSYSITVTDNLGCVETNNFIVDSNGPTVGCTDPNADNYDPNAVCDCGCCFIEGCIDPNATNYNPNATVPDGSCEYADIPPSPCVPESLETERFKLDICIAQKGSRWLNNYKIGRTDDCSLMNKWKLILIDYLLSQHELNCLFNCADIESSSVSAVQDCNALWVTGGPSTGQNHDPNHLGASIVNPGEGTTITEYDGYPNGWFGYVPGGSPTCNFSFVGDVVKFDLPTGHPLATWLNGTIWTLTANPANNPTGMHQGCKLSKIQHYTQCLDYRSVTITTTENYYDKYINFVTKFCADCDTKILKNKTN